MDKDKQFQKEITWCIEQLRMGIYNKSSTNKQAKEYEKVLKILTSNKSSLIKKRQAMHHMFGDYRKKIEADEKVCEKETLKLLQATKISSKELNKSQGRFLKSATSGIKEVSSQLDSDCNKLCTETCSPESCSETIQDEKLLNKVTTDNSNSGDFKFNFVIDT